MEQQDRQDPALLGAAQSQSATVHSRLDRTEDRELHLVSEPLFRPNSESFPTSSVHPPGGNRKERPHEDAFDRAAPRRSLHDPPRIRLGVPGQGPLGPPRPRRRPVHGLLTTGEQPSGPLPDPDPFDLEEACLDHANRNGRQPPVDAGSSGLHCRLGPEPALSSASPSSPSSRALSPARGAQRPGFRGRCRRLPSATPRPASAPTRRLTRSMSPTSGTAPSP